MAMTNAERQRRYRERHVAVSKDKIMDEETLSRAIAAINNTARVENVAGDQLGVLGPEPLYVVVNPEQVAHAVIAAISPIRLVDSATTD